MTVSILKVGPQATLQGLARAGYRHQGVPGAGAADPLSLALANRAIGNGACALAIEAPYGGLQLRFEGATTFALGGAVAPAHLGAREIAFYAPIEAAAGEVLEIGAPPAGLRVYLSITGGFEGQTFLQNRSTYLPAQFGGHKGRSLQVGDVVSVSNEKPSHPSTPIPAALQPFLSDQWPLRVMPGRELRLLTPESQEALFAESFTVDRRTDRMGAALTGPSLKRVQDDQMPSAPVFPGTVQLPPSGQPFLLLADAPTTGGYPRIAQVIRADRHRLGQMRPGDRVSFVETEERDARDVLISKRSSLAGLFSPEVLAEIL